MQNPVIFLPGILSSSLQDEYPLHPQELWSAVLYKEFERISLHPDNLLYEASEPALVKHGGVLGLIYNELLQVLRHELTPAQDQPTPVFAFPYDWRQDVARTSQGLAEFIEEVLARTKLLRHYKDNRQNLKVDLVGHSMGGLVISEYLNQFGSRLRVNKVATLATPFKGSLEAVAKLLTGMGYLVGTHPSERERESARSTPSVYQLLPSFPGATLALAPGVETDLFKAQAWQPSLVATLKEYIRIYSVDAGDEAANTIQAQKILQTLLDQARAHRQRVDGLSLAKAGLQPSAWLGVVGLGTQTRLSLKISLKDNAPWFEIHDEEMTESWWKQDVNSTQTGDGSVPLSGALPTFLPPETLVGVTPSDFGFFELQDSAMAGLIGLHAQIPNMDLAQRLVIKHLKPDYTGAVWGWALPGMQDRWQPPIANLQQKRW